MKRNKKVSKTEEIFLEYINEREIYYRQKVLKRCPLKDIIQESLSYQELVILKRLMFREFPEHTDYLLKILVLQ